MCEAAFTRCFSEDGKRQVSVPKPLALTSPLALPPLQTALREEARKENARSGGSLITPYAALSEQSELVLFSVLYFYLFMYLFEREGERMCMSGGGTE